MYIDFNWHSKLPRLEMYWSTQYSVIHTPGITNIMPRGRFEQFFRCYICAAVVQSIPVGQPGHDRLFKVRKLLDLLMARFESHPAQ